MVSSEQGVGRALSGTWASRAAQATPKEIPRREDSARKDVAGQSSQMELQFKIRKCVATKGLTDAIFGCVASKGLSGAIFVSVAGKGVTGFYDVGGIVGRCREADRRRRADHNEIVSQE